MPEPILTMDIAVHLTGGAPSPPLTLDTRLTPQWSGGFDPLLFDPSAFTVDWDNSRQLQLATSLDSALAESALPRASRHQLIPPWRISIGGVDVPWYRLLPGLSVRESIDGTTQFTFSMPRRGVAHDPYTEPLGPPLSWLGVPGGKRPVTITAEFLTPSGRKSIPLVRDGLLDNTSGETSPSRDVRTWNGGGAHARIDRIPVTYQAPPGHGQTSGTVVRRLLELAGVDPGKIAISGGRRLYKEISVIDANAIQVANDILLPESRLVYHDGRSDTWQLLDYSGISGRRVEVVLTEDDVLSVLGSLGDGAASDAPTSIILTSTGQVTREECGRRIAYKVIDVFTIREIQGWFSTQQSDGSIFDNAQPGGWGGSPAELRLTERTVLVTEYDCETVVSEESVTYQWFAPEATRYLVDSTGAIEFYTQNVFFYDQGVQKDDSSPARLWKSERFVPVAWSRSENEYDDRLYLVKKELYEGGWQIVEGPIKDRSSIGGEWQSVPFETGPTGTRYTADLRLVYERGGSIAERWYGPRSVHNEESWDFGQSRILTRRPVSGPHGSTTTDESGALIFPSRTNQETVEFIVNDDGFIISESSVLRKTFAAQGVGDYLYQSFGESPHSSPRWRVYETVETRFSAVGEANHDRVTIRYDYAGKLADRKIETNVEGYLPAAQQRTDIVPPPSAFDDPAEAEFARAASRNESRPLKVEVSAPALSDILIPWTMKGVTVQYAENEDDLVAVGIHMFRERSSIEVRVPLPFNPLIRPGHRVILSLQSIGMYYDILVEACEHHQDESAAWTQIIGRHDVV